MSNLPLAFSFLLPLDQIEMLPIKPALYPLTQRSPTFLAPGTGFAEDNFSTDWGRGRGGFRR